MEPERTHVGPNRDWANMRLIPNPNSFGPKGVDVGSTTADMGQNRDYIGPRKAHVGPIRTWAVAKPNPNYLGPKEQRCQCGLSSDRRMAE